MPYRRNFKKTYRKRRTFRRKTGGWMGTAQKAFRIAKRVASLVNAEAKDYYSTAGFSNADYNGTITSLNGGITTGTADGQRTGDSIKLKTCTIRGMVKLNGATTIDVVRMIVYWDKQNDIATAGDLLNTVGVVNAVFSPKDDDKYYDSKILVDKIFNLSTALAPQKLFKEVIKIDQHTKYNNSTNVIENGALKILFIGQQLPAGSPSVFLFNNKLTFMDN